MASVWICAICLLDPTRWYLGQNKNLKNSGTSKHSKWVLFFFCYGLGPPFKSQSRGPQMKDTPTHRSCTKNGPLLKLVSLTAMAPHSRGLIRIRNATAAIGKALLSSAGKTPPCFDFHYTWVDVPPCLPAAIHPSLSTLRTHAAAAAALER